MISLGFQPQAGGAGTCRRPLGADRLAAAPVPVPVPVPIACRRPLSAGADRRPLAADRLPPTAWRRCRPPAGGRLGLVPTGDRLAPVPTACRRPPGVGAGADRLPAAAWG
ncbi:MAG TPA: hypothetical protein VIE43_27165 [Thermoanaerobaculia bacterium]|nr:hypothetical protein [Thermoanaerobaculia bacterium]